MDLKRIAKDTAKTLVSYLTYQAVRIVAAQLRETNPPLSMWFHSFSSTTTIQDGDAYLRKLMQENQDLAFRVMTVRAHLAEELADYLPEMIRSGVQQANMEHRRDYLERITSLELGDDVPDSKKSGVEKRELSEEQVSRESDRQTGNAPEVTQDTVAHPRVESEAMESEDTSNLEHNPESSEQ